MFDVLVLCYGDHVNLARRCLSSLLSKREKPYINIHIGLNQCSVQTREFCRTLLDKNMVSTLIDSNINLNKDPMMRKLIDCVSSDYFLWLDDDSYVNANGWDTELSKKIQDNPETDIFGFPHISGRDPAYDDYLQKRPWYKENVLDKHRIYFPLGGFWIAKKSYLEKHDYPDKGMFSRMDQHMDDRLLGDMISITGGKFKHLDGWQSRFCVNKSPRRGD